MAAGAGRGTGTGIGTGAGRGPGTGPGNGGAVSHLCSSARSELKCRSPGVRTGRRVHTGMAAAAGRAGLGLAGTGKVRIGGGERVYGEFGGRANPGGDPWGDPGWA